MPVNGSMPNVQALYFIKELRLSDTFEVSDRWLFPEYVYRNVIVYLICTVLAFSFLAGAR